MAEDPTQQAALIGIISKGYGIKSAQALGLTGASFLAGSY